MKSTAKKPTQLDVARVAGVSTATVSRVVNKRGRVNREASNQVIAAIERLHYVPHAGARALATQRSRTLGVIVPTLSNEAYTQGITGFGRIAQVKGYSMIMSVSNACESQERLLVGNMIERGVDGLMFIGSTYRESVHERLGAVGVHYLHAWANDELNHVAQIGFDHARALHAVVDHLVELGHRRVGVLTATGHSNNASSVRCTGVRDRLGFHGLELPSSNLFSVHDSVQASREAFWKVIDQDISALICCTDVLAIGALLEAERSGLRVPHELSITGFGDINQSKVLTPALTSVSTEASLAGARAARSLISAVEGQAKLESVQMEARLVVRDSSGRCR